jgi:phage terminase large subunit-like protein
MEARRPGKLERLAAERQARDLALCALPGGHPKGFVFDFEAGDRVVQFLETYCRHHKGEWAGKPLVLQEWQKDLVRQAFGWKRADGSRRFRICYWEIARKNGKSQIAAGLALYLVVADNEPGAEVYSSATKKDQARIVWQAAAEMVKASPELRRWARVLRNNISVERMGSKFEPLGADADTLDGLNPHGNIVDELHAHKNRDLWDVLDTAMGARRQPMTIAITTAGSYEPETIGWQQHDYACKVLEGTVEDDGFHAAIFAADEPPEDDHGFYFTEAAWGQANPNFGVSVKPEYLKGQAEKAQKQPSFFNTFLRLHLNVWTRTVKRWLSVDDWAACEPPTPPGADARALAIEREALLAGKMCFGGLDLSSKLDLSAFVLSFPDPLEPKKSADFICRFWLPRGTVKREAEKGNTYWEVWERQGWLTVTPGNVIDYDFIAAELKALKERFDIREIGFDPWNATQLSTQLMGDGFTMVEARQGFKTLSEPSKIFEAMIVEKKARHMNNPILRFCVANAAKTEDAAGNIKPDKAESKGKIDGVVSLVMGLSRMILLQVDQKSPYEEEGQGFRQL